MAEPLEPGFIHDTYRRLKRISTAIQKDNQPKGQVSLYTDLNTGQVTGTFAFPITEEDNPELNASVIKAIDYAQ